MLPARGPLPLSPVRWKAFVSALDRPIRLKPRLRRLLTEPSVLER
ncbi:MAG: DUF1778 domain-containing protein [Elusimicrobia bacterium]|nr:DUF1778 domain-containing protein [Elusimicrobiota bacterium]